jgi:hypothetical protein
MADSATPDTKKVTAIVMSRREGRIANLLKERLAKSNISETPSKSTGAESKLPKRQPPFAP